MGIPLEAYLMAGDNNQDRKIARDAELKAVLEDDNAAPELREHARQLLEMRRHVGGMRRGFTLGTVAAKVDLAASIRE